VSQELRRRWAASAAAWEETNEPWHRDTLPVSARMVELIAPQPGHTVLELGAGLGDTGFLAAELVQPGGTLISSDMVPEMLSAAQRRAETLGLGNVRFKQIDAQRPIDLPAASVDGVLARWVFMLLDDPEAALRETRRILRPGGRVALTAWTGVDDNQWMAQPIRALERRGALDPLDPDAPGPMRWADPATIVEHLYAAGFDDPEVEPLEFLVRFASVRDWWETSYRRSTRMASARPFDEGDVLAELGAAATPYAALDGGLAVPARTWVAAATA
jgi:ubiquinone/menaquinone biosynthesis C-methylase UbiE